VGFGKVAGDETRRLCIGQDSDLGGDCFWKVRVWDNKDSVSEWSRPAHWSAGLLNPSDWKAQWIGMEYGKTENQTAAAIESAKWIWAEVPTEGTSRRSKSFSQNNRTAR
jgi:alpha-L-rhamnosidase